MYAFRRHYVKKYDDDHQKNGTMYVLHAAVSQRLRSILIVSP